MQNIHSTIVNFAGEMELIRTNALTRFIWIITSLIILNCSLGGPEPESQAKRGLYGQNIVESLVGMIVEEFLSLKDSINENQSSDMDKSKALYIMEANDFPPLPASLNFVFKSNKINTAKILIYKESYKEQYHPENIPPPPKV